MHSWYLRRYPVIVEVPASYTATITAPGGTIYQFVDATFTVSTDVPSPTYTWSAAGGSVISGQGTTSAVIRFSSSGSQSVTCDVTGGGTASDTEPVTVTAFSPLALSGLSAWFDAGDLSSLTLDGSNNVSQWNDKSGNARHATQSTVLNRPGYYAAQLNGLGAVRGNGTSSFLTFTGGSLASGYTVFVVYDIASATTTGIFSQYPSPGTGNGFSLWTGLCRTGRAGGAVSFPSGSPTTAGTPVSEVIRIDGANPTSNFAFLATWNAAERTGTVAQNAGTPAAATAYIGAVNPTDSNSGANIYEIAIFSRSITNTERDLLKSYVTSKWGLTWA